MKFETYLNEMTPQYVQPTDFDLDDEIYNKNYCKKLMKSSKLKKLNYNFKNGSILYQDGTKIFLENNGKILYFVQYENNKFKPIPYNITTQIKLWKKRGGGSDLIGLPSKIFYDLILEKTGIVSADKDQTTDGEDFWIDRLGQAFEYNYYCYYINTNSPKELIKINNMNEFKKIRKEKDLWGFGTRYQSRKLIISKINLDEYLTGK